LESDREQAEESRVTLCLLPNQWGDLQKKLPGGACALTPPEQDHQSGFTPDRPTL
jgi:hypothetical protein